MNLVESVAVKNDLYYIGYSDKMCRVGRGDDSVIDITKDADGMYCLQKHVLKKNTGMLFSMDMILNCDRYELEEGILYLMRNDSRLNSLDV